MVNRTQALVLAFGLAAWAGLIVILLTAPEVYDRTLPTLGPRRTVEIAFVTLVAAFLGLLAVGVVRRWRWLFWSILAAFALGLVRVPVAVQQLLGQPRDPAWYVVLQAASGLVQFVIALVMLADYRRAGTWGSGASAGAGRSLAGARRRVNGRLSSACRCERQRTCDRRLRPRFPDGSQTEPVRDPVGHPQRVGDDGQRRVHRGAGDEEAGVGDVEVVQVVQLAVEVQRGGGRVGAEADGPVLVGHAGDAEPAAAVAVVLQHVLPALHRVEQAHELVPQPGVRGEVRRR